jgi:hypothetical protein
VLRNPDPGGKLEGVGKEIYLNQIQPAKHKRQKNINYVLVTYDEETYKIMFLE